jgi:hypothetical protein
MKVKIEEDDIKKEEDNDLLKWHTVAGLPKIEFSFEQSPWYLRDEFIDELVGPSALKAYVDEVSKAEKLKKDSTASDSKRNKKRKDCEATLVSKLQDTPTTAKEIIGPLADATEQKRRTDFIDWRKFRCDYPNISNNEIKKMQRKCWELHRTFIRRARKHAYGLSTRGVLMGTVPFQEGTLKHLPDARLAFVPMAALENISSKNQERLEELDNKLIVRLRGGGLDARDSNRGHSLGHTAVSGGGHANRALGISGTYHMNKHLRNTRSNDSTLRSGAARMRGGGDEEEEEAVEWLEKGDDLQQEVLDVICDIVLEAYGHCSWFRQVQAKYRDIPSDRFLPGRRIPATHIWYTRDPKSYHVHTDINTQPPAFVMCPKTYDGGDLLVWDPYKEHVLRAKLPKGKILGGAWAQHPHCNTYVAKKEDRHSFVIYIDNRMLSKSYKTADECSAIKAQHGK